MNIDLNQAEIDLILFCLSTTKFDSDESWEKLRPQLIAKIFFAMPSANSPD